MKEILIISGKGGTGKTSLVGSFAQLSKNALFCDCDVDASNLHLLLAPEIQKSEEFYAGWIPKLDVKKCNNCGKCYSLCKFNAITFFNDMPKIMTTMCEGCCVCAEYCPNQAIEMQPRHCGRWFQSNTSYGTLFHAELFPGEENSGRLIAELRRAAKSEGLLQQADYLISDGPPGIGCSVISSMSGVDLVVLVTEPTPSGIHDLKRVAQLAHQFAIPTKIIINKWDLNPNLSQEISEFCQEFSIEEIGRVSYDMIFSKMLRNGKTVLSEPSSNAAQEVINIWNKLINTLTI